MTRTITKPEWIEFSIEDLLEDVDTIDDNGLSIRNFAINEEQLTIALFGSTSQYGVVRLEFLATSEEIKSILTEPLNGISDFIKKEEVRTKIYETVSE